MQRFQPFSVTHGAVVAALVAAVWSLVALRRRWRDGPRAVALDRCLAAAALAVYAVANAWPLLPRHFALGRSLPIHVCDLTTLCVPLALRGNWRPARALLYFWGLGLSTQGFITPDLQDGPARVGFWTFWLAHFSVVGGALYDVIGRDYRPDWRDYRIAVVASVIYVILVLPLDAELGVNYGYVGPSTPGLPTLVDALGPWPWRVPVMFAAGTAVMFFLTLPWELVRRHSTPRPGHNLLAGADR
jgi:hypothetical integral membrane protein (TIGR02206 family)